MDNKTSSWKTDFEIGIAAVDSQHETFLNLVDRVFADLKHNSDPLIRVGLIAELNAYVKFHFISEENLMRMNGYPDLAAHQQEHRHMIDILNHKEIRLELDSSQESIEDLVSFLKDWFVGHSQNSDSRFSRYLNAHESAAV